MTLHVNDFHALHVSTNTLLFITNTNSLPSAACDKEGLRHHYDAFYKFSCFFYGFGYLIPFFVRLIPFQLQGFQE